MTRYVSIFCVAFLFTTLGTAFAGNAPATDAPMQATKPVIDPKAREVATELVSLVNAHAEMDRIFDTGRNNLQSLITRDNPKQRQKAQKFVNDAIYSAMLAHMKEIDSNTADIYAQNYSVDELKQIVTFYKTPAGRKLQKTMPEMIEKSMSVNQPVLKAVMREALVSLADTLIKNGMIVPRELVY